MENIYYNPEKFDLESVLEIDYSDQNYCFDTRVIWKHKTTGKLYTARDSGCSYPSPFEGYSKVEDLEEFNANTLIKEAKEEAASKYYRGDKIGEFIEKCRELE